MIPRGMIHIRDFLEYLVAKAENGNGRRRRGKTQPALSLDNIDLTTMLSATRILRPVLFVPPLHAGRGTAGADADDAHAYGRWSSTNMGEPTGSSRSRIWWN